MQIKKKIAIKFKIFEFQICLLKPSNIRGKILPKWGKIPQIMKKFPKWGKNFPNGEKSPKWENSKHLTPKWEKLGESGK